MPQPIHTVVAVRFLNAKPLVDGLEHESSVQLASDVPSRLLETLTKGAADIALCPVIDFQISSTELCLVPAGAIGSDGSTLTVRVFSRVPMDRATHVHTDADSHTSVALLRVVFDELYGRAPEISTLLSPNVNGTDNAPETLLLIGDKVVQNQPDASRYAHQLDLGDAWKRITGLPFVFACWMARVGDDLGSVPEILARRRELNRSRIGEIAAAHASSSGWPEDLAAEYLREILRYELGPRELHSIELFWSRCHDLGLIDGLRPMKLYENSGRPDQPDR
jgi:chorismate dehydratase